LLVHLYFVLDPNLSNRTELQLSSHLPLK